MLPLDFFNLNPKTTRVCSLGNAGGMSGAQLYRVSADENDYCLRCWPTAHPSPDRLVWIHQQMIRARGAGCRFVPTVIPARDGKTYVQLRGHLWELTEWMPGVADFHREPTDARLASALSCLGRLHESLGHLGSSQSEGFQSMLDVSPGIRQRRQLVRQALTDWNQTQLILNRIDERHGVEVQQLCQAIAGRVAPKGSSSPRLAVCGEQLDAVADLRVQLQPCLRDIWHDHLLFAHDNVAGLVDYGAMSLESPASDLARLLGSLVPCQPGRWQVGLTTYEGIRTLSDAERQLIGVYGFVNPVLAGLNWIRWLFTEQLHFESKSSVLARLRSTLTQLELN